jgi:hypothetical protein
MGRFTDINFTFPQWVGDHVTPGLLYEVKAKPRPLSPFPGPVLGYLCCGVPW